VLSRDEILDVLSQYRRKHVQQYGIEQIGIFGSYARGQATEASDVDVDVRLRHVSLFLLS
jgi:predicted nucleotidyltransferase